MAKADPARLAALKAIHQVIQQEAFSNEVIEKSAEFKQLDSQGRAFASALVYGTLNRRLALDKIIEDQASRPLNKIDPLVLNILRLGLWQLLYSYSVPRFAAVDETVKLCAAIGRKSAKAFVNAVLRNVDPEHISWRTKDKGIKLGLGNELFGLFRKWYGEAIAIDLGNYFLRDNFDISLRVNTRKIDSTKLRQKLEDEGALVEPGHYFPSALSLKLQDLRLDELESFKQGLFMVQAEAAQAVGAVSLAENCQSIIDLCAAPGGKSCDIAMRMPEGARLLAMDLSLERLELAKINAKRLGVEMDFLSQDATDPTYPIRLQQRYAYLAQGADLILLDVPCSGLGLLARKPELRWRVGYEDLLRFPPLQMEILRLAAQMTKPGSRLIYSTCTLNPAENEELLEEFLAGPEGQAFTREDIRPRLPKKLIQRLETDSSLAELLAQGYLLFRPDVSGGDGFFICSLLRSSD